jgi:hypothetical protein
MKHHNLFNQATHDSANLRAEDGWQMRDRRSALYSAILTPLLIFAIIAILLLLICHPAFGQAAGGRIADCVKDATGDARGAGGDAGYRRDRVRAALWVAGADWRENGAAEAGEIVCVSAEAAAGDIGGGDAAGGAERVRQGTREQGTGNKGTGNREQGTGNRRDYQGL